MATKSLLCPLLAYFILSTFAFNLTWKTEKSIQMPLPVSSQLVCDLNDDPIYFIGGRTYSNNTFTSTNTIYIFNKSNNTFQKSNITLPNSAYFASNYICNNRTIYMFGAGGNNPGQLWTFNIDTQTISNIPFPKSVNQVSFPCTTINTDNNSIYIIGGIDNNNSISNQILQFNYTSNTFINTSHFTPMPLGLYGSMCRILNNTNINGTHSKNGILYIIGGESEKGSNKNIYGYNISSNIWQQIAILKQSRSFTKSIYYKNNNFILIIGGGSKSDNKFTNTTDIFYIGNYSVIKAFGVELPFEIEYNTVSEHKNKIYVWGGYAMINGSERNVNEIVVFDLPENDKSFTWKTIGLIAGACVLMLFCGGCAYLLCGRSKYTQNDDNGINYRYQK